MMSLGDDRHALRTLDDAAAAGALDDPRTAVAYLASQQLTFGEELNPPVRRAVLLLAAGGDPTRALDPDGRAVTALAADLALPERRAELATVLADLRAQSRDLPRMAAAIAALEADHELAWRLVAAALLAEELGAA